MIYADTDFFMALVKESDWLKQRAEILLKEFKGEICTSPATLIEFLLLSKQHGFDPISVLIDVLEIAELRGGESQVFLLAAHYVKNKGANVFDALHAAWCGKGGTILSSDKVFDRLGLQRIPLDEGARDAA